MAVPAPGTEEDTADTRGRSGRVKAIQETKKTTIHPGKKKVARPHKPGSLTKTLKPCTFFSVENAL